MVVVFPSPLLHPEGFSQGCRARGILLQHMPTADFSAALELYPVLYLHSNAPLGLTLSNVLWSLPQQGLIPLLLCCSLRSSSDPFCLLISTLDSVVPTTA